MDIDPNLIPLVAIVMGVSVILVEQKLTIALKISTHVCLLGHGHIVFRGAPDELTGNPKLLKDWLAV